MDTSQHDNFKELIRFYTQTGMFPKLKVKTKINDSNNDLALKINIPKSSAYDDSCARIKIRFNDDHFKIITYIDGDVSKSKENVYMESIVNGRHIYNCFINAIEPIYIINNCCSYDNSELFIESFFTNFYQNNIESNVNSYDKLCSVCFTKTVKENIYYDSNYIRVCNNQNCIINCRNMALDDIVMSKYKFNTDVAKLFIKLSCNALFSKNRFTPYPLVLENNNIIDEYQKGVDVFSNLKSDKTSESLEKYIIDTLDKYVDKLYFDDYNFKFKNPKIYEFVKFVFLNMRMDVGYFDMSDNEEDMFTQYTNVWDNDSIVFNVTHDATKEESFANCGDTTYAFHGSPFHNWYSIMCNGLKNYSGTAKMTTGQAHGPGIYLGIEESTSKSYAKNSKSGTMLAITEVKYPSKYIKGNFCYVVPEEENVIIKYLIYIKKETESKKQTVKYLTKDYPHIQKQSVLGNVTTMTKRITVENGNIRKFVKKFNRKSDFKLEVESELECTDICVNIPDLETSIYVNYGHNYPMFPPIITITSTIDFVNNELMSIIIIDDNDDNNNKDKDNKDNDDDNINSKYKKIAMLECDTRIMYNYVDPVMRPTSWKYKYELSEIVKYFVKNL